jgi:hypothetical protein
MIVKTIGILAVALVLSLCLIVIVGCAVALLGGYNNERMEDKQ